METPTVLTVDVIIFLSSDFVIMSNQMNIFANISQTSILSRNIPLFFSRFLFVAAVVSKVLDLDRF